MNRIEKLIEEMCPEGVERIKLAELGSFSRGGSIKKDQLLEDGYPAIHYGEIFTIYGLHFEKTNSYVASDVFEQQPKAIFGDLLITLSDVTPNNVGIATAYVGKEEIAVGGDILIFRHKMNPKFLSYILKTPDYQRQKTRVVTGSTVRHVSKAGLSKISIPVPPLEIQKEIVNILDKFTQLEAELEAELEAREKQYEEVRRRLLDFESDTSNHPLGEMIREVCPEGVPYKRLDEVFEIRGGYTPSKSKSEYWEDGSIPWFRMDDIRSSGRILSSSSQLISKSAVKTKGLFPADSIIISTSATIGEHALIKVPFVANQRFSVLQRRYEFTEKLDMKFAFYLGYGLGEYCKDNTSVSGFASVVMNAFKSYLLPLPPLEIQKEIVRILDNLDSLVNSVNEGIPAEIAARRKQYEYYRDKLLTFKELDAA